MENFIKHFQLVFLTSVFLITASGCNSYVEKAKSGVNAEEAVNPDFASVQKNVIQPYCVSCHGSGGSPALDSYAAVKANASQIYSTVVVNRTMPMGQTLPAPLIQMVANWVNSGTPEKIARDIVQVPDEVTGATPTFSSVLSKILQPNCGACHGPGSTHPIANYELLIKNKWVVPGNPQASELYQAIVTKRMPPGNPLRQQDMNTIETWITAGAPNK